MAGNYSIQFADASLPKGPMTERVFPDFDALVRFIRENRSDAWANAVNIHLPARAPDEERQTIRSMGFQPN